MGILLAALIVVLIYYFLNNSKGFESKGRNHNDSLDILKVRYANGEISDEDYKKMSELLK